MKFKKVGKSLPEMDPKTPIPMLSVASRQVFKPYPPATCNIHPYAHHKKIIHVTVLFIFCPKKELYFM